MIEKELTVTMTVDTLPAKALDTDSDTPDIPVSVVPKKTPAKKVTAKKAAAKKGRP